MARNGLYKGGKSIASNGYMLVRVGTAHHLADVRGYAYEHRLVAEAKLGRRLIKGEQVHHLNGDKLDNRAENIEVMRSLAHHLNKHRKKDSNRRLADQHNPIARCACGCGEWFSQFDKHGRPRQFISGHNPHDLSKREAFLKAAGDGSHLRIIAARTGQSLQAVKVMASKLAAQGKVKRLRKGFYGKADRHLVD